MTVTGTTPYPWPWSGMLDPARCALVVTGADPWWSATVPGGPGPVTDAITTLTPLVAQTFLVRNAPATRGRRPERVPPSIPDVGIPVAAGGIDGFFASPLDHLLRRSGTDLLLLVGFGLETTVHSTMRSANDRGYECLLVADACLPVDPSLVRPSTSMVEHSGGIFGAVGSVAAVATTLAATGGDRTIGGAP